MEKDGGASQWRRQDLGKGGSLSVRVHEVRPLGGLGVLSRNNFLERALRCNLDSFFIINEK